jgi:hypothetical protein
MPGDFVMQVGDQGCECFLHRTGSQSQAAIAKEIEIRVYAVNQVSRPCGIWRGRIREPAGERVQIIRRRKLAFNHHPIERQSDAAAARQTARLRYRQTHAGLCRLFANARFSGRELQVKRAPVRTVGHFPGGRERFEYICFQVLTRLSHRVRSTYVEN